MRDKIKEALDLLLSGDVSLDKTLDTIVKIADTYSQPESLESRKKAFRESLIAVVLEEDRKTYKEGYNEALVKSFWDYWTEISEKGRKFKFEKQDTFNIARRFVTWKKNNQKFSIVGMLQSKKKN